MYITLLPDNMMENSDIRTNQSFFWRYSDGVIPSCCLNFLAKYDWSIIPTLAAMSPKGRSVPLRRSLACWIIASSIHADGDFPVAPFTTLLRWFGVIPNRWAYSATGRLRFPSPLRSSLRHLLQSLILIRHPLHLSTHSLLPLLLLHICPPHPSSSTSSLCITHIPRTLYKTPHL